MGISRLHFPNSFTPPRLSIVIGRTRIGAGVEFRTSIASDHHAAQHRAVIP
jgi:hypothetical protein